MKTYFQNVPLYFNEENHEYTHHKGEKYISCTQLISQYKEKFDTEKIARMVAKKKNLSVEEVLASWKKAEKDGTEYGTLIHKNVEKYCLHNTCDESLRSIIIQLHDMLSPRLNDAYFEQLLWDDSIKVCGTADLVNIDGDYFDIIDYKTNKKFQFESTYSNPLMFKKPISHLQINEFNTYCLQLSLYAKFVEELTGKIRRDLIVYWLDRNDSSTDFPEGGIWKEYHLNFLEDEIENMIKHFSHKDPILKQILRNKNL